jgi:hypothetical protein
VPVTSLPAFLVARDGVYLRKRILLGLSQTKLERPCLGVSHDENDTKGL